VITVPVVGTAAATTDALRKRVPAALIVILVAAAGIRMAGIGRHSLWFDEMVSVTSATGGALREPIAGRTGGALFEAADLWHDNTVGRVVTALTSMDSGNGLLHGLLLHGWIEAFGISDAVVRAPSAIAGVVIVLMIYRLGAVLFTTGVGYAAAAFAAVHPLLVRYSQEARSYALATALTLVATELFFRLSTETPRKMWLGVLYGAVAGGALLSHYLTAGVFIAHAVLACARFRDLRVWRSAAVAAAVAGVMMFAWMRSGGAEGLTRITAMNNAYKAAAGAGDDFARPFTASRAAQGLVQMTAAMTGITLQGAGLRLRHIGPVLVVPVLLVAAGIREQIRAQRKPSVIAAVVLAMSGPGLSLAFAARAGHVVPFQPLYASFATPYAVLLLGTGLVAAWSSRRHRWPWEGVTAMVAVAVVLVSLTTVYRDLPWSRPPNPYAILAREVSQSAHPGDILVFRTVEDARLCTLYLPVNARLPEAVDRTLRHDAVLRTTAADRRHWMVPRYPWLTHWSN
jgi:uncharacterized membrane protein